MFAPVGRGVQDCLGCVYTSWVFGCVFQVDGDEDGPGVGEEGLVEPVVAGGGLAGVLHAVEDAFDHVPPLVRLPVAIPWGRTVPLGRCGRRQAERLGRQPGGTPVRAVHERARAHGPRRARCPGSDGSRRPRSRRRMARELWYSTLPGRRRRTGSPFFGAPVACRWTFTPVGSMAGTCDNYHAKLKSLTMSGSPL